MLWQNDHLWFSVRCSQSVSTLTLYTPLLSECLKNPAQLCVSIHAHACNWTVHSAHVYYSQSVKPICTNCNPYHILRSNYVMREIKKTIVQHHGNHCEFEYESANWSLQNTVAQIHSGIDELTAHTFHRCHFPRVTWNASWISIRLAFGQCRFVPVTVTNDCNWFVRKQTGVVWWHLQHRYIRLVKATCEMICMAKFCFYQCFVG
jgi:hypothetical protein